MSDVRDILEWSRMCSDFEILSGKGETAGRCSSLSRLSWVVVEHVVKGWGLYKVPRSLRHSAQGLWFCWVTHFIQCGTDIHVPSFRKWKWRIMMSETATLSCVDIWLQDWKASCLNWNCISLYLDMRITKVRMQQDRLRQRRNSSPFNIFGAFVCVCAIYLSKRASAHANFFPAGCSNNANWWTIVWRCGAEPLLYWQSLNYGILWRRVTIYYSQVIDDFEKCGHVVCMFPSNYINQQPIWLRWKIPFLRGLSTWAFPYVLHVPSGLLE